MMHIAFCTDTNYVMPCGVAMTSICENNAEDITFHIVVTDSCDREREKEEKIKPLFDIAKKYGKNIEHYLLKEEFLAPFVCDGANYISTTAFSRIFLPDILPNDVKKVIYFDCDLICDGSLSDLWNFKIDQDIPLSAALDCSYAWISHYFRAHIPPTHLYFNSGVLLINLDCWRNNNYTEQVVKCAIEYKFPFLDQDALNHVFCGRIKYFNYKFNVQSSSVIDSVEHSHITMEFYDEMKYACENPIIFHYATENKPWKKGWCPRQDLWDKYVSKTIWEQFKPKEEYYTRFHRTSLYIGFQNAYSWDPITFNKILSSYLRLYTIAYKFKNKKYILLLVSKMLNLLASFLENVYFLKKK